jgi:hypothetical protein
MRCDHVFVSKGRFYERQQWLSGSELFTVFHLRKCAHCDKTERKVELKKRVTASPDNYERQLRFSGIKPASQLN